MFRRVLLRTLDRAISSQSGLAVAYVERLRRSDPSLSPAAVVRKLDRRYLAAVTTSGTAVGATSTVPGIGTMWAFGAISAESVVFLEATAFYTVAVAHVHGLDAGNDEARKALVMTVMMGSEGTAIVSAVAGGSSGGRGSLAGRLVGLPGLDTVRRRLQGGFLRKYATKRVGLALGRLAPAGIGAAIGGWGNRRLGRSVIRTSREAFGAPPAGWPVTS